MQGPAPPPFPTFLPSSHPPPMIDINLLRDDYRARKAELFGDIATSGQSVRGLSLIHI